MRNFLNSLVPSPLLRESINLFVTCNEMLENNIKLIMTSSLQSIFHFPSSTLCKYVVNSFIKHFILISKTFFSVYNCEVVTAKYSYSCKEVQIQLTTDQFLLCYRKHPTERILQQLFC
jgi:hypothetical protein